jgi:hypothetical protein
MAFDANPRVERPQSIEEGQIMGLAKLQIWITSEGDPCKISERDEHDNTPWVVAIWHCDGRLLEWCGRKYFNLVARCGHLEVEVPPGCYVIRAADGMALHPTGAVTGNHWSDHAVVAACCDEAVCVTLFSPSAHNCGFGFLRVVERLIAAKMILPEVGQRLVADLKATLERLPKSHFDVLALPAMDDLLNAAEKPPKKSAAKE